jgi:hypothetical protein
MKNNVFYKPPKENIQRRQSEEYGAKKWVPLFLSNDQETPCPERHEHNRRSEVVHHLTVKLFPQGYEAKAFSIITKKCLLSTHVLQKGKDQ